MDNQSSSHGVLIGIIVVLLILVIGFLAYKEGYFKAETEDTSRVEINLGGGEN